MKIIIALTLLFVFASAPYYTDYDVSHNFPECHQECENEGKEGSGSY